MVLQQIPNSPCRDFFGGKTRVFRSLCSSMSGPFGLAISYQC